ncbi:MAG: hypothetical protein NTZ16_06400 [Verrucomicrobia bacterium]|nr:hypothetical protein [Verrucomicrobiota bacterium]
MKKFVVLGGLLGLLAVGAYLGLPVYREWKQKRFQTQAREFMAKEDYRNAALSARQALNLNPSSVEAARIMAQVTEKFHSPLALAWWQKVLNLEPNSVTNRLDLARCALLLGNYLRADQALREIVPAEQNSATYHQLAAMVAMAENNIAKADWHFGRAAELDPQNKSFQFNRAIIHLQAKNKGLVATAMATLETLTADTAFRKDALRHLAMAAVKNNEFSQAEEFARQLQSAAGATFEDRILQLSILQTIASPDFAAKLGQLKTESTKTPEQANTLASWMIAHGMAAAAGEWLATLPDSLQTQPPVRMARADALVARSDWKGLDALLADQNWGELDFIRHAQLALSAFQQRQNMAAQASWQNAVRLAGDRLKPLTLLTRLATTWGWDKEREDLLWFITQRYPAERWALQSLNQLYLAGGNTRGLQRVFTTLLDYNSTDVIAKNNLASVTLLLNPQSTRAYELARAGYEKYPKNPAFTATYAYSLHQQGQTAAGIKALAALPEVQLEIPGIAVYYGVLLAAAGETNKARKYLDIAATASLLPEEKEMAQVARRAL